MTAKQIIALIIGIAALAVTAWKGPQAWGLVASGLTAIVIFVSTLRIAPKQDQEYIQDLEDALTQQQLANTMADPNSAPVSDALKSRSRDRFNRRVVRL
jgi:hypothetical protein